MRDTGAFSFGFLVHAYPYGGGGGGISPRMGQKSWGIRTYLYCPYGGMDGGAMANTITGATS